MSTDLPTEALDGPHLDDEATSAALDGEVTAGEVAHLAACASCQTRVERLRTVQAAVAAPVTVDPAARQAAIAAALGAFDSQTTSAPVSDHVPAPAPSQAAPRPSAPFSPAGAGARPAPLRARPTRAARLAPWLGAAAVLLLVALSVPLLAGLGGGDDDEATTASGETSEESSAADDSGEGATAMAVAPPVDVGDLGDLDAGADLRPVVDAALGPVEDEAPVSDEGASPSEDTEGTTGAGEGTESEEESSGPEGAAAPAPSTAPDGGSELDADEQAAGGAAERASASCETAVRAQLPEAGALLLVGSATVDGDPAFVFGFAAPSERPSVLVALVREDGCALVTFQSYARS